MKFRVKDRDPGGQSMTDPPDPDPQHSFPGTPSLSAYRARVGTVPFQSFLMLFSISTVVQD
jgi:hypothetical protein